MQTFGIMLYFTHEFNCYLFNFGFTFGRFGCVVGHYMELKKAFRGATGE